MMTYLLDWIKLFYIISLWQLLAECWSDNRFAEKEFTDCFIYDRKVTCDKSNDTRQIYPAPTWTCNNMRIGDLRLRRVYVKQTTTKMEFPTQYDKKNDMKALCQALLKEHQINKNLWTAYAKEISSNELTKNRVIFKRTDLAYDWEVVEIRPNITGQGYVKSIACTLDD